MKKLWIIAFILAGLYRSAPAESREISLAWDEVTDAHSYTIFACDLIPDPAVTEPPVPKVWSDLYMIGSILVIDLEDKTLPQWTWAESMLDADGNEMSHCFQVYAVDIIGTYSKIGSNFATSILPMDTTPLIFPRPVTNLTTF